LDILCQLETNGESFVSNTILPHSSTIQRVGKAVNKYGETFAPFISYNMKNGMEVIKFEAKPVIKLVVKGYTLNKLAHT
jgi:hypothetical protein